VLPAGVKFDPTDQELIEHLIQSECGMHAMWHNTGNTLPVMVNGRQMGSKKVLVLHTNKNFDQQRTNWVMHQYH
ncbi:NAC domain-containing protein 75-like, partial [Triticum urartu]|uniref:NAC domain-containing protein 75-like n=1 Tax=Triticum urartu TaxID=4572 RepID=UPI002044A5C8